MKKTFVTGILAALLALGAAPAPAVAQDEVNWQALPAGEDALKTLDREQLRALRTAVRRCEDFRRSNHMHSACVFIDLDRFMRQTDDAALKAYHFALPRIMRYNEARNPGAAVDRVTKERAAALGTSGG